MDSDPSRRRSDLAAALTVGVALLLVALVGCRGRTPSDTDAAAEDVAAVRHRSAVAPEPCCCNLGWEPSSSLITVGPFHPMSPNEDREGLGLLADYRTIHGLDVVAEGHFGRWGCLRDDAWGVLPGGANAKSGDVSGCYKTTLLIDFYDLLGRVERRGFFRVCLERGLAAKVGTVALPKEMRDVFSDVAAHREWHGCAVFVDGKDGMFDLRVQADGEGWHVAPSAYDRPHQLIGYRSGSGEALSPLTGCSWDLSLPSSATDIPRVIAQQKMRVRDTITDLSLPRYVYWDGDGACESADGAQMAAVVEEYLGPKTIARALSDAGLSLAWVRQPAELIVPSSIPCAEAAAKVGAYRLEVGPEGPWRVPNGFPFQGATGVGTPP